MILPRKLRKGEPYSNRYNLWNGLIDYLNSIRLVSGKGILIRQLPSGTVIQAEKRQSNIPASYAAASFYSGPWELSYDPAANLIRCRSGWLVRNGSGIWTGELSITPQTFLVPRMIVVESRIDTGTNNWTTPALNFCDWNSTTGSATNYSYQFPLGLWDYSTKSITQWHFSAAVHIISAYEFEV